MEFSEREIAELASFFAKRFPSFEERADLCEAAGIAAEVQLAGDARAAWVDAIAEAARQGRLVVLVERAVQRRPDDVNLRAMLAVFGSGGRRSGRRWMSVAALLVGVVLVLLMVRGMSGGESELAPQPEPVAAEPAVAEPEPTPAVSEPEPTPAVSEPEPTPAFSEPDPDPVVSEPELALTEPELALTEPDPAPVVTEPEPDPGQVEPAPPQVAAPAAPERTLRCEGPAAEILGYWYAGEDSPGGVGASYTVDGGLNLRATYPSPANGFSPRGELVCTLGHGWVLRIGAEPIFVRGGAWWVPLTPEDIVSR